MVSGFFLYIILIFIHRNKSVVDINMTTNRDELKRDKIFITMYHLELASLQVVNINL